MAAAELDRRGWHLTEEGVSSIGNGEKGNVENMIKKALDSDLRIIGAAWLNEDINRCRLDYVEGPSVLQLQKLRVVSAPKDNEESQTAPKLCRLSLTDGHVTCSAVTLEPIKGLGVNTPPGSKLLLTGTVEVETNFLLLTNKSTSFLGGNVLTLAEPWKLKKSLAKQSQIRSRGEGGPPSFVPFGMRITSEPLPPLKRDTFKSLGNSKEKKVSEGDTEFQQQRQAALQEALQAKSANRGGKTFGGGKLLVNDKDVARITEMGFPVEEATSALKASGGNVSEAINSLVSGGQRFQRGGDRGRTAPRGGGGMGRSDGRRKGREKEFEDDGEDPINTRPSGPATLFDFLETKIPNKEESKKIHKSPEGKMPSSPPPSSSLSNESLVRTNKDTNSRPQRKPTLPSSSGPPPNRTYPHTHQGGYHGNQDYSYGRREKGEDSNYRGQQQQQQQQSIPPRFAKLARGDGQRPGSGRNDGGGYRGGGRYDDGGGGANPNPSCIPFKENSQNAANRGAQNYSGSNQNSRSKYNQQIRPEQTELRDSAEQPSSDSQKGPYHRRGDNGGRREGNSRQQNYGDAQYRNSPRNDGRGNNNKSSNRPYHPHQQPGLMPSPYSPQDSQYSSVPGKQGYPDQQFTADGGLSFNVGDPCHAKYWEDNEFYPAVVEAVGANGSTVVVTFVGYGNQEEVFVGDIQPVQQPRWPYPVPAPMYDLPGMNPALHDPAAFHGPQSFVPAMEFSRRGDYHNNFSNNSGGGRRHDNSDRRKPTQPYYQPPNQKSH